MTYRTTSWNTLMSDKYPSMSPYNYCANNPVILVDPDGREIEKWIPNGKDGWTADSDLDNAFTLYSASGMSMNQCVGILGNKTVAAGTEVTPDEYGQYQVILSTNQSTQSQSSSTNNLNTSAIANNFDNVTEALGPLGAIIPLSYKAGKEWGTSSWFD